MIIGGTLKKHELTFETNSPKSAITIKGGLAGRQAFFITSPHGHRVNLHIEENALTLSKGTTNAFTYEEVSDIVKKVRRFGKLDKKEAKGLTNSARELLDSGHTLFFPDIFNPTIEVSFHHSHTSLCFPTIGEKQLEELYRALYVAAHHSFGDHIKLFSNNTDTISLYNYQTSGMYISRAWFETMADLLVEYGILQEEDIECFVLKSTTFAIKSIAFMEADKLCKQADAQFEEADDQADTPANDKMLKTILAILANLSKKGSFLDLDISQLKIIAAIFVYPKSVEEYALPDAIAQLLISFIEHFSNEIKAACIHHHIIIDRIATFQALLEQYDTGHQN